MHDELPSLTGFDAVTQALKHERFPIDKPDLYYAVGSLVIHGDAGDRVPVRQLLDRLGAARFETPEEAVAALHEVARNVIPSSAADAMLSPGDTAPGF